MALTGEWYICLLATSRGMEGSVRLSIQRWPEPVPTTAIGQLRGHARQKHCVCVYVYACIPWRQAQNHGRKWYIYHFM